MSYGKKLTQLCSIIFLSGLLLLYAAGCEGQEKSEADNAKLTAKIEEQQAEIKEGEQEKQAAVVQSKGISMKELLEDVFYWKLLLKNSYGKKAPDFVLTDINGKEHKLSDYRGKDVILLSWTVWSPGSRSQIDILNEIREQISEDKLAILAVCAKTERESLEEVKEFAAKRKIKFPIFYAGLDALPTPFDVNQYVPCSYFIEPDGSFKLIAEEIISIKYVKKVLATQR